MKLFTREAYEGDGNLWRDAGRRYVEYLREQEGVLPPHLLALTRLPNTDDGLIVQVQYDRRRRVLVLTLRCGELTMGYYDLILRYEDAELSHEDERTLAHIARTTKNAWQHQSDLYVDEIEIREGRIEHRLFFHPGIWLAIRCGSLSWEQVDRPDRELPESKNRFPNGRTALRPRGQRRAADAPAPAIRRRRR